MNDALWLKLGKTDPKHTKGFKRAGGFSGTALKPMWVWQRLTEEFGPCGTGWGFGEPTFQVVPTATEILVYCTVSAWHGSPENLLYGVGGDKALTVNKYGPSSDDEAFKKAFTDALMNAFKFIGVGADIHMGLFDDSKYIDKMREEFSPPVRPGKQEDTHGPDWPNLTNPSSITSNAAKKDAALVAASIDVKSRLDFAPTVRDLESLISDVTPTVAKFPETWRRVLWGEYSATLAELKAAE